MVRATIFLVMSMGALADDKEYMISNTDHTGQCMYIHADGDLELYGCVAGYRDQKFHLEQINAADVGNRTNGYLIRSADNGLCLATQIDAEIFGWSDCSTTDQGGNGDRSWLLTEQQGGFRFESARFPGTCVATDDGWELFRYPCGSGGQTFQFDPPFNPNEHGTPFTNPEGLWYLAASNNGDISKSLTVGMSYTDSTTVTDQDQIGLGYSMAMGGGEDVVFLDLKATETISASYTHTWSQAVMTSSTTTTEEGCTATCHGSDLPEGASGWNLLQWELRGTSSKGVLSTRTCNYLCLPQPMQPRCPVNCCQDRNCQTCSDCFKDNSTDLALMMV